MRIAGVGFRAGNAHPYGPTTAGDAQHGANERDTLTRRAIGQPYAQGRADDVDRGRW